MICGICGITPKVEIAQRNTENVLALKNIEVGFPTVHILFMFKADHNDLLLTLVFVVHNKYTRPL